MDQSLIPQVGGSVGLGLAIKNYCNFVVYTGKLDVISQDSQQQILSQPHRPSYQEGPWL